MWLFTTIGFYSAVRVADKDRDCIPKGRDPEEQYIMIRGRVREDVENLAVLLKESCITESEPEILEWVGRDYPYRVIIEKDEWVELLSELADMVDYSNFKNTVKKCAGVARAGLYSRIWGVMLSAESMLGHKVSNYSAYDTFQDKFQDQFHYDDDYYVEDEDKERESRLGTKLNNLYKRIVRK